MKNFFLLNIKNSIRLEFGFTIETGEASTSTSGERVIKEEKKEFKSRKKVNKIVSLSHPGTVGKGPSRWVDELRAKGLNR